MPSKRPNPIVLRPRKGSELDAAWQATGRDNKQIGEQIHAVFAAANTRKDQTDE